MAKRFFLTLIVFATMICGSTLDAQNSVAYVNTLDIINSLPDKTSATERLTTLSENYKQELKIPEPYHLSETDLENRIQNFTNLAQKDIEENEQQLLDPIKIKVNDAIKAVGIEQNFTVIYDLDSPGIMFVSPNSVDANQLVKSKLGVR